MWRIPRTGTFCASEGEPRIGGDISQWTDRYSIASGRLRAPCASLNSPLAISTRPLVFAVIPRQHGKGPEKVHAFPQTRKQLSFPCLRRNLSVSLGAVSPECQVCTFHATEFRPGSFPTPTQLYLSIFSTVVVSQILPVYSLGSAVSTIICRVLPPNCKKIPLGEQEHAQSVHWHTAPPPLPEVRLDKFTLRASGQLQSRYALRWSILRMFRDHQANRPNLTGYAMMCHSWIRVKHCLARYADRLRVGCVRAKIGH